MAATTSKEGLVVLANDMLSKLHVNAQVHHWSDINADVFVTLLEGLLAESSPGIIRPARTREDEIHNCQTVIDTLATDVLKTPLFHITGQAIVEGDTASVGNLLDIISGLMEYLLDKIGSDISTDNDDMQEEMEDPDCVTPTVIDDILERELGRDSRALYDNGKAQYQSDRDINAKDQASAAAPPRGSNASADSDNTSELIALGKSAGSATSPGRSMVETTADLVALGDSIYKTSPAKRATATLPTTAQLTGHTRFSWTDDKADVLASGSRNSTTQLAWENRIRKKQPGIPATAERSQPSNSHPSQNQGLRTVSPSSTANRLRSAAPSSSHGTTGGRETSAHHSSPAARDVFTADLLGRYSGLTGMSVPHIATSPVSAMHGRRAELRGTGPADLGPTSTLSYDVASLSSNLPCSVAHEQPPTLSKQPAGSDFTTVGQTRYGGTPPLGAPVPGQSVPLAVPTRGAACSFENSTTPFNCGDTVPAVSQSSATADSLQPPNGLLSSTAPTTGPAAAVRDHKQQPYQNLHSLVQDTVDMSRAAMRTSPFKESTTPHAMQHDGAVENLSQHLSQWSLGSPASAHTLPGYCNFQDATQASSLADRQSLISPSTTTSRDAARRKVSFLTSQPTKDPSAGSAITGTRTHGAEAVLSAHFKHHSGHAPLDGSQRHSKASTSTATARPRSMRPSSTVGKKVRAGKAKAVTQARQNGVSGRTRGSVPARSINDYLRKYYGHDHRVQSFSDGEIEYGSDRDDYSAGVDGDVSDIDSDVLLERYHELPGRLRKSVRFEEISDNSSPGRMGDIRHRLKLEDRKARVKADLIGQQYEDNLVDMEQDVNDALQKTRKKSQETETDYKKKVMKAQRPKDRTSRKYSGRSSVLYSKPRVRHRRTASYRGRKRSLSASAGIGKPREPVVGQEIIPLLLEEFPFLYLSSETLHRLWQQSSRQVEHLCKAEHDVKRKKSLAQCQIEEAEKRQKIITNIMRKELEHRQRLQDLKEGKRQQYQVYAQLRDRRLQSARARRYYEEYQVRMRSKMLKKRTKEELVFKRLFREGIDIQKDRIRELRKYAHEQREQRAKKQRDELESQENYYRDQFNLLADLMAKERRDIEIRETAQAKVLQKMQTELRRKMEGDIKNLQEQIFRDEDDVYFRELDAERLRQQLHLAHYQAHV